MKTIYLIFIFLILGILFGFIMARVLVFISNWFLRKKVREEALNEKDRTFFYQQKPYNLKENIEFEEKKRKKSGFFEIFKKKQMKGGISDYGNTTKQGIIETTRGESVPRTRDNFEPSPESSPSSTNPTTDGRGEQGSPTSPARGERGVFTRNLFEKGKKFN